MCEIISAILYLVKSDCQWRIPSKDFTPWQTVYFLGILTADFMRTYRRYAIIVIMLIAAIITTPDIFTLLLVSIPMYLLYEVSIWLVNRTQH